MDGQATAGRPCLRDPIPEIADAAGFLDDAVAAHLTGRSDAAEQLILRANLQQLRESAGEKKE